MASRDLRRVQLGLESTPGTAVAATTIWRGTGLIQDKRDLKWPNETIGHYMGVTRTYTPKLLAGITFEQVEATFEQIGYLFAAGVENVVSGTPDGTSGGSGYIYEYDLSDTSANSVKTYTIEAGDDAQAEEIEYAVVEAIRLSGKGGEALFMSADWFGRQASKCSFTSSLSLPTVEEILFSKGKLYLDAVSGTLGATQKQNTFLGMDLELKTGWQPRWTGDGGVLFSGIRLSRPELRVKVTFEHDATAVAEKDYWRGETPRQMRITFQGSALAVAGAYTYKTLQIDLAGQWDNFNKIGELNGNDVIEGTFRAAYDATAGLLARFTVVNELASLP